MYDGFYENFCILVDTREKKNDHLTNFWRENNIRYKSKKLNVGDYSFELDGLTLESSIVIERKNSLDELCKNFTKDRERFRREFIRGQENKMFVYLLIENATIEDIYNHNYRSKMHPNSLLGSLKAWQKKYNIYTVFVGKQAAGIYILDSFKKYIKKFLVSPVIENKKEDI